MPEIACPKCGQPLSLNSDTGMFRCPNCNYKRPETLDEASERIRAQGQRPTVPISHRGEIDIRARSLFDSAQDYLWRNDPAAALRALSEAIHVQPDFADAHLWIAKISDDEKVKRDHLGEIIAHDPGHLEAMRLLMVLNKQMTPEEAELSRQNNAPVVKHAEGAVSAKTMALICPVCGGALTIDEDNGRVVCRFCGHTEPLAANQHVSDGAEVLSQAMLKRRIQPVKWIVGARILHCNRCGAERTIPASKLSGACPFCGSTQVIEQDALQTIEKPDGLVQFAISEERSKGGDPRALERRWRTDCGHL